jgi:hypothetical protein
MATFRYHDIEPDVLAAFALGLNTVCGATAAELDQVFAAGTSFLISLSFPPTVFSRVSPYWTTLTGWSEAALLSEPWTAKVSPSDLAVVLSAVSGLAPETQVLELNFEFRKSDATYLALTSSLSLCADGKLYGTHFEQAAIDPLEAL